MTPLDVLWGVSGSAARPPPAWVGSCCSPGQIASIPFGGQFKTSDLQPPGSGPKLFFSAVRPKARFSLLDALYSLYEHGTLRRWSEYSTLQQHFEVSRHPHQLYINNLDAPHKALQQPYMRFT